MPVSGIGGHTGVGHGGLSVSQRRALLQSKAKTEANIKAAYQSELPPQTGVGSPGASFAGAQAAPPAAGGGGGVNVSA